MDRGVREVHAPDGGVWWVKRAWLPRYRSLRDRVRGWTQGRPPVWWDWPLRQFAGSPRYVADAAPDRRPDLLGAEARDVDLLQALGLPLPDPGGAATAVDAVPDLPILPILDVGGGGGDALGDAVAAPVPLLDPGGGGSDTTAAAVSAVSALTDVGGGGFDTAAGSASFVDVGGGGGLGPSDGGFDLDLDAGDGDGLPVVLVVALAAVAAVAVLSVAWFVLLPLLLAVVDGTVLLLVLVSAGLVRLLFRRPWDVVAVRDFPGGSRRGLRWEVRGYHRAGRVRDDVARALETGTDPDLAVARVLVREHRDDDPGGSARSVITWEGPVPPPPRLSSRERRRSAPGRRRRAARR